MRLLKLSTRPAVGEQQVCHVQISEGRRHDADDEEEDDRDEGDGQTRLLPAPLFLHVVPDLQAHAQSPRSMHSADEVDVSEAQDRQWYDLERECVVSKCL